MRFVSITLFFLTFLPGTIHTKKLADRAKKQYRTIKKTSKNFALITNLYNETNKERINEYLTCLEYNLAHPHIKNIHVVYDISKDDDTNTILNYLKQNNISISYINGRPTYQYCFDLANTLYPNSKVILSNADIYFNHTLQLLENYDLRGKFLTLTRWNVTHNDTLEPYIVKNVKNKYEGNENSQDTWIFLTPITEIECDNIQLGTKHCDGRIAYEANKSNFDVLNPCLTIQCCHLQLSGIRNYPYVPRETKIVMGVPWCTLSVENRKKRSQFERTRPQATEIQTILSCFTRAS